MQQLRRLTLAAACAGGLIVPAAALAAGRPGPPAAGVWAIAPHQGFRVASNHRSVSGVRVSLNSSGCAKGTATVLGSLKISTISSGGYTNWVIGHGDANGNVHGLAVKIKVGGHIKRGALSFIWRVDEQPNDNSGQLAIPGCTVTFHAHHA